MFVLESLDVSILARSIRISNKDRSREGGAASAKKRVCYGHEDTRDDPLQTVRESSRRNEQLISCQLYCTGINSLGVCINKTINYWLRSPSDTVQNPMFVNFLLRPGGHSCAGCSAGLSLYFLDSRSDIHGRFILDSIDQLIPTVGNVLRKRVVVVIGLLTSGGERIELRAVWSSMNCNDPHSQ